MNNILGKKNLTRACAFMLIVVMAVPALPGWSVNAGTESYPKLTFSNEGIIETEAGSGYSISGTALSITASGIYEVSGTCGDGSINIAKNLSVTLILNDLDLASESAAPIVSEQGNNVTIVSEGTNTLTDNSNDAGIKAKKNGVMTLTGDGTLNVISTLKNGIKGASGTEIIVSDSALALNITSATNGLSSDGKVTVNAGEVNIDAGNDGIKSEPDEGDTNSQAVVDINGGNITISAVGDGIQATNYANISDGIFDFETGGGYEATLGEDDSAKGIKADVGVNISGGTFNMNCADDAIHSDKDVTLTGGDFNIYTGDDALHADYILTLGNSSTAGPNININACYEGLEGAVVNMNSGTGNIVASDDGVNAANSDLPATYAFSINVNGGNWHINAGGDGVDSNNDIYFNGGVVESFGSKNDGDAALDYDGNCYYNGGTFLAVGMNGMMQNIQSGVSVSFGTTGMGGQPWQSNNSVSIKSGDTISIKDSNQNEIYSSTGIKSANCVVLAAPGLVSGNTYYLYINGAQVASTSAETGSAADNGGQNPPGGNNQPQPPSQLASSISLSKATATLKKGKSLILTASVSPSFPGSTGVVWTSSKPSVAKVSSSGKVTAVKKGTAIITATTTDGSNLKATCKVTVKQPVTKLKLSKKKVTLKKGKEVKLKLTVSPSNANNKSVTWKSSNKKVATVNSKGKVVAKKKGTAIITVKAKDGSGKTVKCKVVVK